MLDVLAERFTAHEREPEAGGRAPTLADSFPQQWNYIVSESLFNAVCCSRRAGKTAGAVRRAARLLISKPGCRVFYVTLIRRNCRKYFWWPLQQMLEALGWTYDANESDLILQVENGSWCQAIGVDDMAGIKAVKGDRADLFMVDECQENLDDVLTTLIDVAATPMLTDTGGMLDLMGTVPEVEPTFFSKALDSDGWAHFHWTMFDHDFPDPRETKWERVVEICKKRGLALDVKATNDNDGRLVLIPGPGCHPIVLREYFGIRAKDPSKLAYEYQAGRNDYDPATINFDEPGPHRHSMGLDLGFEDNDAIVVHHWRTDDGERRLRVRFQWQHNTVDVDDLADIVTLVDGVYRPGHICGDHGGHGATKVMKTIEARLGFVIEKKPGDVMVSVRLMNDDYRTARLLHPTTDTETVRVLSMLEKPTARVLAALERKGPWSAERKERIRKLLTPPPDAKADLSKDLGKVAKSSRNGRVEINKKGFHSDVSEANRYAHHAARHYAAKAPKAPETREERRDRQWREQRKREMNPW